MIFYILLATILVGAVAVVVSAYRDGDTWTGIFIALFGLVMGPLIAFGLLTAGASALPGEQVTHTTALRALGNDSSISGSFFLGSGVIDEELVYQYIAETDDGGFYLDSVPAHRVVVYENSTADTARMVTYTHEVALWWYVPATVTSFRQYKVEFHIPAGSVDNTYRISVTD
jgi:hypothetical protein